jgi:hypothetical protein
MEMPRADAGERSRWSSVAGTNTSNQIFHFTLGGYLLVIECSIGLYYYVIIYGGVL